MNGFLRGIKLILFLNCEQSAMLTSESFDRSLSFFERFAVRAHHFICRRSRRLAAQLGMLEAKCVEMRDKLAESGLTIELSPEIVQRIRAEIRRQVDR